MKASKHFFQGSFLFLKKSSLIVYFPSQIFNFSTIICVLCTLKFCKNEVCMHLVDDNIYNVRTCVSLGNGS
jgi:hypothetical protein